MSSVHFGAGFFPIRIGISVFIHALQTCPLGSVKSLSILQSQATEMFVKLKSTY